jgi:hypothetical protein
MVLPQVVGKAGSANGTKLLRASRRIAANVPKLRKFTHTVEIEPWRRFK